MSKQGKSEKVQRKKAPAGPSRREEGLRNTQECMKNAQDKSRKIFLKLVEETVDPKSFIDMAKYMNPDIYNDAVIDRAASSICGYPLCPKQFTNVFGDKTYKIHNNKVYDVTMRKNFCSDICYEASEIVKKQISLEPLYTREASIETIPDVTVPVLKNLKGLVGQYIDIAGGYNDIKTTKNQKSHSFTSFTEVAENSLKMCAENKEADETNNSEAANETRKVPKNKNKPKKNKQGMKSSTLIENECKKGYVLNSEQTDTQNHVDETKMNKSLNDTSDTLAAVHQIEQCVREWMTFDSMRFILGDVYLRGMLEDIGSRWEDFDSAAGMKLGVEAKAKYIAICRKLDEQERNDIVGPDLAVHDVSSRAARPLPDYRQLQEDAKKQQLKVVSFLGGKDQYEDAPCDTSNMANESNQSTLPLIDSYAQVEWRQSIVLDKLDKYLIPFLSLTKLVESEINHLIKDLVMTFDLSPNNITFKPGQWSLITLMMLKMLSIRYSAVQNGLQRQEFSEFLITLLLTFNLDALYLDRFISFITEVRYILSKSSTKEAAGDNQNVESVKNNILVEENMLSRDLQRMQVIAEEIENESKIMHEEQNDLKTPASSLGTDIVVNSETHTESTTVEDLD